MKRLAFRKDPRDMSDAEKIIVNYPLTAREEELLVPIVERLLAEGKEIPESSQELLELLPKLETTTDTTKGRLYWGAMTLPQGSELIGTVTRETGETGALIKLPTGIYVQGNAGALRSLPW